MLAGARAVPAETKDNRLLMSKTWRRFVQHTQLLLDSYRHWLHAELVDRAASPEEQARSLYHAPFVVVSHGTEADPLLSYGNQAALALWEMDIDTLCGMPSRQTAEAMHRDERARLLARTSEKGYVDDYRGIRISGTGKRFLIQRAIVWNLVDHQGRDQGQAATFSHWTFLESPLSENHG